MKAIVIALVASVLGAAVVDMCKDETRTRLGRLPVWLIRLAAKRVPHNDRADLQDEWNAELTFILRGTEGLPVTRLVRGIAYSADLLFRGAPRLAREIRAEATAVAVAETSEADGATWASLFPDGRDIFYEGDDPAGFVRQIKVQFGFDPSADPRWEVQTGGGKERSRWDSYSFRCPAEHLDAIYGNADFPMGS